MKKNKRRLPLQTALSGKEVGGEDEIVLRVKKWGVQTGVKGGLYRKHSSCWDWFPVLVSFFFIFTVVDSHDEN